MLLFMSLPGAVPRALLYNLHEHVSEPRLSESCVGISGCDFRWSQRTVVYHRGGGSLWGSGSMWMRSLWEWVLMLLLTGFVDEIGCEV